MTEFSELIPQRGERTLIYGGTRSGKSSLADWMARAMQAERPEMMPLLLDTKPRFRAQFIAHGPGLRWRKEAKGLYSSWEAGPTYPNSVICPLDIDLTSSNPFRNLWKPGELVVLQSGDSSDRRRMLAIARRFLNMNPKRRERLLWVNEGLDFYQRNSLGVVAANDVILDSARAGGERGFGLLFEAHRPKGIPPLLNTLTSNVVLFHLRFGGDMRYLYDMGIPEEEEMPTGDYIFKHYRIRPGGTVSDPMTVKMKYPDWYLKQLSST
jgi:energy-coupling factor transporter ATP-binding protein EcfA2